MKRLLVVALLGSILLPTEPVGATFHSIMIREVFAGTSGEYVELQMYSTGQRFVNGTALRVFDAAGTASTDFDITSDVPAGDNQRSILIGKPVDGVTPDFDRALGLSGSAGKVCFLGTADEMIDCVSWGTYTGSSTESGTPAEAIPMEQSLERGITRGCATLLDRPDDTEDSAADFDVATRSPRNNATPPSEIACPGGGGDDGDLAPPVTTIDRPRQGKTYLPSKLRMLRGTASDNSGMVVEVELALRKKLVSGACRWWNGGGFVKRPCSSKLFFDATGQGSWSYRLPSKLTPSVRTKVASYTLYARSRDAAGNLDQLFTKGRNANRFELSG